MLKKIIIISIVIINIFFTTYAFAETKTTLNNSILNIWQGTGDGGGTCNMRGYTCTFCDAIIITTNITKLLVVLGIALTTILILYGAIRLMLSGGSENQLSDARKIITKALIGLAIIGGAWLIIDTVYKTLVKNGDWDKIEFLGCQSGKIDFKNRNTGSGSGLKSWAGGEIPKSDPNVKEFNNENTDANDNGICKTDNQTSIKDKLLSFFLGKEVSAGDTNVLVLKKIVRYAGKLTYTNDVNLRTRIDDGYADCSGFTWKIFQCVGIEIPNNTKDLAKWKGNNDAKRINVKKLSDEDLSNPEILNRGDILGFDVYCKTDWWDNVYDPEKKDPRRFDENGNYDPFTMGHVMFFFDLDEKGVPIIIHQTNPKDGTNGTYTEQIKDIYWGPWRQCGYIIHIL